MLNRRIIGDSPPHYGGKQARATVMPWHEGQCDLKYEADGAEQVARFVNYEVARTAAIQAIFSNNVEINNVCVTDVATTDHPVKTYETAKAWLSHHETSLSIG